MGCPARTRNFVQTSGSWGRNKEAAATWPGGTALGLSQCLTPDSWLGSWVNEKDIQVFPHSVPGAPLLSAMVLCPELPG